jgi:hypothetical protein
MDDRQARRLQQKRKLLLGRMGQIEEFLRGSVVLMKRPCTYPRCRKCASGERHPTWGLTVSEKGKTRTAYLGVKRLDAARRMTENYRRLRALVEQISTINRALVTRRVPMMKGSSDGQAEGGQAGWGTPHPRGPRIVPARGGAVVRPDDEPGGRSGHVRRHRGAGRDGGPGDDPESPAGSAGGRGQVASGRGNVSEVRTPDAPGKEALRAQPPDRLRDRQL